MIARRRRRARGAIFVESVIVCALLMLMMVAGLFMHRLYWTKLHVIGQARATAWTQALQGCNQAASLDAVSHANGPDTPSVTVDTDSVPSFFGSVQHNRGSASGSVVSPVGLGRQSYTLDTANTIACNEIPASKRGDVKSVIGYVGSTLLPSFF